MVAERLNGNNTEGIRKESGNGSCPTMLDLFSCRGNRLEQARRYFNSGIQLKREFAAAAGALARLASESFAKITRIQAAQKEFVVVVEEQRSSQVAGTVYLKMIDELSEQGLSPKEILDFYRKCLKINTRVSAFMYKFRKTDGSGNFHPETASQEEKGCNFITTVLNQEAGTPPAWFKGNKQRWENFVTEHGLFSYYLYPEFTLQNKPHKPGDEEKYLSCTFEQAVPEWFTESGDIIPNRKEVEAELEEDQKESARLIAQLHKMTDGQLYLQGVVTEKWLKAVPRFEDRRRRLLSAVDGFAGAITFLGATEAMSEYDLDFTKAPSMTADQVDSTIVPVEKSHILTLRRFEALDSVVLSRESIALWLEAQLQKGGIITSVKDLPNQRFIDIFDALLDQSETRGQELLAGLRLEDKKAFKVLNYEIAPLLAILPIDQKSYIIELMHTYQCDATEPVIWAIAETLSSKLKGTERDFLSEYTSAAVSQVKKYAISWIRNHWKWAFSRLEKVVSTKVPAEPVSSHQPEETEPTTTVKEDEALDGLETAIIDVQKGNLNGWHLYYTFHRSTQDPSCVEIEGVTEEEKEASFRQFVATCSIPCSIKPESVIRAFEWLVTVPQQVENIRMSKEVNGETFKKIKRGRNRIFYSMDRERRRITFFVHQKKAMSYGF